MPYNELPYNKVKFKSSHNSYNRRENILDQIIWKNSHNLGCRGLEFDLSQSECENHFSVAHKFWYDSDAPRLSQYLNELRVWSLENPDHDCITLHLDLKNTEGQFIEKLDHYIEKYFSVGSDTKLFKPSDIATSYDTLIEGVNKNGWPTMNELKGKFILCISGKGDYKKAYANHNFKERLAFADIDIEYDEIPNLCNQVFLNYKLGTWNEEKWQPAFLKTKEKYPNAIIRGYVLNNNNIWNDALNSQCNILSTNKISNHDWCKVGNAPFVKI